MVYDFAHPAQGRYHMQMFRDHAQRVADYLEYHIRGRLVKARHWRKERGMWASRKVLPSFKVDMRETLPNGSRNPDWRKYNRFEPMADVVLRYFEMFRENDGNLAETWKQIEHVGPFFPEITEEIIPAGFKVTEHLRRRSQKTGQLSPSPSGLQNMLINVVYIGHWVHKQVITQWYNHAAIIPEELFMFAYNRISRVDFHGQANPHYVAYRPWVRHAKEDRTEEPPIYAYLTYTDDLEDEPHKMLASIWSPGNKKYKYQLYHNIWNINCPPDLPDESL